MRTEVSLLLVLLMLTAAAHAGEQACRDGQCDEEDDEGADKYSRERNKPENIKDQMAVLKDALLDLMKDPYNPDVLRSSLAELALFAETPAGKKFLDQFGEVLNGDGGGAGGAIARQMLASVLSGRLDVNKIMSQGISASSLASLAEGFLAKDGNQGKGMKMEEVMPIMNNFLRVIKDEQASPFLLDRLSDAFKDSMSVDQLKKFEKTAAGVLSGIRMAGNDDKDFIYDESALEAFESFLQDFVDEQGWGWEKTGPTFIKEIKKVMRLFAGSEDQIGRLLPSLMEAIADAKPTKGELSQIIDNFGGILGNVVKKDSAEPEFVNILLEKLKVPLQQAQAEAKKKNLKTSASSDISSEDISRFDDTNVKIEQKDTTKTGKNVTKKDTPSGKIIDNESDFPSMEVVEQAIKKAEGAFGNVPDLSKLMQSLSALGNDPIAMQKIMMKLAAGGGNFDVNSLMEMFPEVDGLGDVTTYIHQIQNSKTEQEIASHFHSVMDAVGDAFSLLKSEDVRRAAIEQALPYIRMAHDFLKEPFALLKIQMGVTSVANMYDTSVTKVIDKAAPHVEDLLANIGIMLDFPTFCNEAHTYLLKMYNDIYQSPKSVFKKLSGKKEDNYIVDSVDHAVGEPTIKAYLSYRQIRRKPDCLLQTLCRANRDVTETDASSHGVRPAFMKGTSRLFGLLLALSEHDLDSPVHEQVSEAISEGQEDGNCEGLYPAECDDYQNMDISF